MPHTEEATGASPSLAHDPSPAPAAGTARGIAADDSAFLAPPS